MDVRLDFWLLFFLLSAVEAQKGQKGEIRCGVCPTYFQKICGFDILTGATHIFDNHCIMDLYNCKRGTGFSEIKYDRCLYYGNFAYVHGYKHEDEDYGEDNIIVKHTKKNPDFIV